MQYIVVGGGPAGCAAAYTLRKAGHEVRLFEAADQVGGRTKQLKRAGFNLATGALFLMGGIYPRTSAILKEMGRWNTLRPWDGASELINRDDARYPVSFVKLTSYLRISPLGFFDKLRVVWAGMKLMASNGAKNPFDGHALAQFDDGEDLEAWSRRQLGSRPYEYIIRPLMDFLYAVPASWLSTPFPKAIIQQAHKMALSVPPGGVGQVSEWLIQGSPGVELHLSTRVDRIARQGRGYVVSTQDRAYAADGLVVATEAFVAAQLMKDLLSATAVQRLKDAPYTDYAHVAIAYTKNPWPSHPADIVLPVGEGETRKVGAIVLHSRRHPSSVPPGGELVGVYFNTPPLPSMTDEDIRLEALQITHRAFGPAPEPTFVHLFRYDKGLTIAKPGHYRNMDALHAEMPPGICLAGDYFSQAGVEAAVFSGEQAAKHLLVQPIGRGTDH